MPKTVETRILPLDLTRCMDKFPIMAKMTLIESSAYYSKYIFHYLTSFWKQHFSPALIWKYLFLYPYAKFLFAVSHLRRQNNFIKGFGIRVYGKQNGICIMFMFILLFLCNIPEDFIIWILNFSSRSFIKVFNKRALNLKLQDVHWITSPKLLTFICLFKVQKAILSMNNPPPIVNTEPFLCH